MRLRIGRSVFRKEMLQSMLNEFPIFDYEDIQLIPNKCIINSRSEADTTVQFGNHTFKLPCSRAVGAWWLLLHHAPF